MRTNLICNQNQSLQNQVQMSSQEDYEINFIPPKHKVKIKHLGDSLTKQNENARVFSFRNHSMSRDQNQFNEDIPNMIKQSKISNIRNNHFVENSEEEQENFLLNVNISLHELTEKMKRKSLKFIKRQYEQSSEIRENLNKIKQIEAHDFDLLIENFIITIFDIIEAEENKKFLENKLKKNQKIVSVNRQQRTKLKVIPSSQDNKMAFKNFQTYIQKIENECESHKTQYFSMKQKYKHLENQILKMTLDFKNKRNLYIGQIQKLTDILEASFLSVGKQFLSLEYRKSNIPESNEYGVPQTNLQNQMYRSYLKKPTASQIIKNKAQSVNSKSEAKNQSSQPSITETKNLAVEQIKKSYIDTESVIRASILQNKSRILQADDDMKVSIYQKRKQSFKQSPSMYGLSEGISTYSKEFKQKPRKLSMKQGNYGYESATALKKYSTIID